MKMTFQINLQYRIMSKAWSNVHNIIGFDIRYLQHTVFKNTKTINTRLPIQDHVQKVLKIRI